MPTAEIIDLNSRRPFVCRPAPELVIEAPEMARDVAGDVSRFFAANEVYFPPLPEFSEDPRECPDATPAPAADRPVRPVVTLAIIAALAFAAVVALMPAWWA